MANTNDLLNRINSRYSSSMGIEEIVDTLLNGDELNGDENIW